MRFFVVPLLLAAAASAEVFHFAGRQGQSSVYGVRGAVTVGVQELTSDKTALEYNGTLALEQVREGEYLAKFTQFTLEKYNKLNRNINDESLGNLTPEEQLLVDALREQGQYEHEMQRPVKFYMKEGKVVRVEAAKEHQQWSLNIFRGVFTLLQNQVHKPSTLAVPSIEFKYEDGITGNCKVQYEILSQPDEHHSHSGEVYNMTKTVDYKDCLGRPVFRHLKDVPRGCAGVCDNHRPDNFLDKYEEEQTDYELKPTPGCPANHPRHNSLVTVTNVVKYNVTDGRLDEARSQSTDIYRLFGGEIEVFTSLKLRLHSTQGPKIEAPQNVQTYTTLQHRLPVQEESELDIPIYALMKEHSKHQQYPQYFKEHFEAVIRELHQIEQQQHQQGQKNGHEKQTFDTPAYMIELIQAVSGMTEEELKKTIPEVVRRQQPKTLSEEDQLRRQLWIELIGKAGSKTAVKLAVEFIKNKTFTPSEVRRVLQDIAGFQSYPDTDMIEQVLALCTQQEGLTSTGKATACVAAGKIISKGCDSKVFRSGQKEQEKKRSAGRSEQSELEPETEEYEMTMGHLVIKSQLRCTPQKLQQYIERLTQALRQSTNFKQVVAYINGLSKIQKPEVLPTLIGYVNGTAPNMHQLREQGEQQDESVDFVRRVAIVSLRDIATKYPKEINPIVRIIYQNTTEKVQTRLVAFDVWMNTEPAQWEVEKVLWVANKDTSVELTHYVYTALKTAMLAEEPCYQLLAQRIRAVWTQIRPFDSHMKHSQFRSKSIYDWAENFGVRGIWKIITSNTTILPAFTQTKLEQIRGPYLKTLFSAKLLVKGGDKIWDELTGKDGLLERIAHAISGQVRTGERQHQSEQLLEDIAEGLDVKKFDNETPKAVLFWKLLSGEVIIPIDAEYMKELKQELLETVNKVGKKGVSGHYMRVLVPTKAFQVEPTSTGLPIVHSTIHPIVISVRYENVKLHYKNQQGRVLPESFELTGSFKPTVLSYRQSRVFASEKVGQVGPTLKISGIKEFTLGFLFKIGFEHGQRRFQINIKPQFERVFHSGHCTELKLEKNTILDEKPRTKVVDYGKCVKSLHQPIRREQQLGSSKAGMMLRLTGESHQPWSGLPLFGSKDAARNGVLGALLNRLANKGMEHHSISLYLETDKQQPMDEWSAIFDVDTNLDALTKIPVEQQAQKVHKIKAQYQPRRQQQLASELQQVLTKVESLLQKSANEIKGTTIEEQLLVKLEGRYQGHTKNTVNIAMKKIYNFDKTEQHWALAAQSQQSPKAIEIFANVSYPKLGSLFEFDPTDNGDDARMSGTLIAKLKGQQEQIYRVNFQAVKSEKQREVPELESFEMQCLAEQKSGKIMSDSCQNAIKKDNSLDRMEMTVQLPNNVHPEMEQLAKMALAAVKHQYYPNMQSDISGRKQQQQEQTRGGEQEIRISATTVREYQWALLYNVRIEMPRENVTLSNIRLPGFRPVHTQLSVKQQLEHVAARGDWNDICFVGGLGVRTYDKVPFDLSVLNGCEYVVTRDQTVGPTDFTVTFKVVNAETHTKQVRVQLRNTIIVLEPLNHDKLEFPVSVNGTRYSIGFERPILFHYGGNKRAFIGAFDSSEHKGTPTVVVYTQSKELIVLYNGGDTVATVADTKFKGHMNGICGNDNNEASHEFIGPDGHEYQHANEFIASYGIGQQCKTPVEDAKETMMEKLDRELKQIRQMEARKGRMNRKQMRENPHFQNQPQEWQDEVQEFFHGNQRMDYDEPRVPMARIAARDENEHHTSKTHVSFQKDLFCFSVKPMPACKSGYHKEGVLRTEQVESICLEKSSRFAHEAMQQIRKRGTVDVSKLEEHQVERVMTPVSIPKCVRR